MVGEKNVCGKINWVEIFFPDPNYLGSTFFIQTKTSTITILTKLYMFWDLESGTWDLGIGIEDLELGIWDWGLRIWDLRFGIVDLDSS